MTPQGTIAATFIVYVAGLLVIGWFGYRRTQGLADYILGGRRIGRWVAALSAGASDMSGWLLLGLPGYAYAAGLESAWLVLGLLVGTYLNWRLVAPRLRAYSEAANDALTLPEYLEFRFDDHSRLLRVVSAGFILLFFLFYTSSGLVAGGKLFESVFGLPYTAAVLLGAAAILAYTFIGGFLAVSWTDLVQALLMAFALIAVPLVVVWDLGGWTPTLDVVRAVKPALLSPLSAADGSGLSLIAVLSLLGWGLGYFGQPHILARFKAIHSVSEIRPARRIAMSWVLLCMLGAVVVGLSGIAYLDPPLTGPDTEKVFIRLVGLVFHPLLGGVLLAAILAAVMSPADSQLLVASAVFTEDFYKALIRRNATQAELVGVGRAAVGGVALLATWLALDPGRKVLDLVAYAWAGFGAAFGPVMILSLYWPRMTRNGALAGILVGGLTVVLWKLLRGGIFELYELIPGFALSLLAVVIVSRLGRAPAADSLRRFDGLQRSVV